MSDRESDIENEDTFIAEEETTNPETENNTDLPAQSQPDEVENWSKCYDILQRVKKYIAETALPIGQYLRVEDIASLD